MTRVLINGSTGMLSVRAAQLLSQQHEVIVLGRRPPAGPIGHADWLVARLDRKQMLELLRAEQIETVIHLDLLGFDGPLPDHETTVQHNVIGTMELLGACRAASAPDYCAQPRLDLWRQPAQSALDYRRTPNQDAP